MAVEVSTSAWKWRSLAGALILAVASLRVLFLACNCPLDLSPDEAHYWDWSRHLDWSYYSKGPLIACLIRLGCEVFGPLSIALTGNEMLAVRLPAVICGSLLLVSLYILTAQVTRRESLAFCVVAVTLTFPVITAGSSLMTIDAPYTCCWGWALVLAYQALFRGSPWAWPALGVVLGVGMLAKYTMVLFLPSLALFCLFSAPHRHCLWRPGFWVMVGLAGLSCLPILIWNAQHDWVTFRHVGGQAGIVQKGPGIRWFGPLAVIGMQFGLLLGYWFIVWVCAMAANAPWRQRNPERLFLWWLSAPMFLVFFLFGFQNGGGEPNWPITAYLSGLVLGVIWLDEYLPRTTGWSRRFATSALGGALAVGLLICIAIHCGAWTQPLLASFAGPPTATNPTPLRRFDPTCRLKGWPTLAAEVDRLRKELGENGEVPILAGTVWNQPGILGFYCAGHPPVFSIGPAVGDRHSQYDFWRPNPLCDTNAYKGRTFIIVALGPMPLAEAFDQVEEARVVTHKEAGQPISRWEVRVCRGFRGFGEDVRRRGGVF